MCTAERRGTEVVVSQWCCGEGEGHAPSEPEGNILKPIMVASIADSCQSVMSLRSTIALTGACNLTFIIVQDHKLIFKIWW